MSSNSTSPADIYGGTWAGISGGRYMRAAGAWDNGGSNTITIQQMPAHSHSVTAFFTTYSNMAGSGFATVPADWGTVTTSSVGGGNRSTQPIKMFGRGTELPKEGEC